MINNISIEGFKCFDKGKFSFRPITFLTGGNACGKSSLLQLLLLLSKIEGENEQLVFPQIGNISLGLPNKLLSTSTQNGKISVSICVDDKSYFFDLKIKEGIGYQNCFVVSGNEIDSFKKHFSQYYLSAERLGPQTFHKIGGRNGYVGMHGEFAVETIALYEKNGRLSNPKGYTIPTLGCANVGFTDICEKWLSKIFDKTEISISDIGDDAMERLMLKNDSEFFIPYATGFGITYCLPIVVQGLICAIGRKGVLLIENPEVHLHPKSQSMLGRFLAQIAKCGVQIIVETHSEHIINGARIEMGNKNFSSYMNVIYFSKDNGKFAQKEIEINEYGELDSWPKGFFDQEENDLYELLSNQLKK